MGGEDSILVVWVLDQALYQRFHLPGFHVAVTLSFGLRAPQCVPSEIARSFIAKHPAAGQSPSYRVASDAAPESRPPRRVEPRAPYSFEHMASYPGARTNSTALAAFWIGLLSFFCLFGTGGVVAIVLGALALSEIRRSEPRQDGAGLAKAAIGLGVVQLALLVVFFGGMLATMYGSATKSGWTSSKPPPSLPAPSYVLPPAPAPSAAGPRATLATRSREQAVGRITLVDLGTDAGPLARALTRELDKARASNGQAIVLVVGPDCSPCNGVALALRDARLQKALAGVRLVRVDATERVEELELLGIPTDSIPGFALLAAGARPEDYLHGGEWDADIPDNIAPVLIDFVARGHRARRYPWRGMRRPDETAL